VTWWEGLAWVLPRERKGHTRAGKAMAGPAHSREKIRADGQKISYGRRGGRYCMPNRKKHIGGGHRGHKKTGEGKEESHR